MSKAPTVIGNPLVGASSRPSRHPDSQQVTGLPLRVIRVRSDGQEVMPLE
jgi:hypothetical protein